MIVKRFDVKCSRVGLGWFLKFSVWFGLVWGVDLFFSSQTNYYQPGKIPDIAELTDYPYIFHIGFELGQVAEQGGTLIDGVIIRTTKAGDEANSRSGERDRSELVNITILTSRAYELLVKLVNQKRRQISTNIFV